MGTVQGRRSLSPAVLMALTALIGLGWGGVLAGSFQYDDFPNLLNDPATAGGGILLERLIHGVRPLTRLTHVIDNLLWGRWAGGWLLLNFLLHAVTAMGVYSLSRMRGASATLASVAAAVFALQPAHGMTVAYVSGRAAGLMTVLLVAALLAHEHSVRENQARRQARLWRTGAATLFLLACLAKETALCFPLLLVLWEACRVPQRPSWRTLWQRLWPYAVATLVMLVVVLTNQRYEQLMAFSLSLRTPLESLRYNLAALPMTLSLLLRPWELAVVQPAPMLPSHVGTGLLFAWVGVALALRRRSPWATLGMLWPVIALLPSHSVVAKADAVSESGLYLCWVGPGLAVALAGVKRGWMQGSAMNPARHGWPPAGVSVVLLALALTCAWRTMVWSDPVRLWREAVERLPESARAWNNLGMAYIAHSAVPQARHAFDEALRINPRHAEALRNRQLLELVN